MPKPEDSPANFGAAPDPKRIDHNDPTVKIMGRYLQKNAEFAARQEMERLLEEAGKQAGDAPKDV